MSRNPGPHTNAGTGQSAGMGRASAPVKPAGAGRRKRGKHRKRSLRSRIRRLVKSTLVSRGARFIAFLALVAVCVYIVYRIAPHFLDAGE